MVADHQGGQRPGGLVIVRRIVSGEGRKIGMALVKAWLFSSAAFAVAFVAKPIVYTWFEHHPLLVYPLKSFRLLLLAFGACLIFQLVYGGLTYLILTRTGVWSLWTIMISYLAPVLLFSYFASDTPKDVVGTIPWIVLALIVAVVSWFFASPQSQESARNI
jgi:hypothetical protein